MIHALYNLRHLAADIVRWATPADGASLADGGFVIAWAAPWRVTFISADVTTFGDREAVTVTVISSGATFYRSHMLPPRLPALTLCTYDTDEDAERGYCNGGCVLRPHKFWTDRGPAAVCQRHGCNVAGTGDRCNDGECAGRD